MLGQEREIGAIVVVAEKHGLPPVSALRDMMRHGRDNDTGEASHGTRLSGGGRAVNLV
jgi:hypothetical protein